MLNDRLDGIAARWRESMENLEPGSAVILKTDTLGNLHGVVTEIIHRKTGGNPLALSSWIARVATANGPRTIDLSFLQIAKENGPHTAGALEYQRRTHRDAGEDITDMFDKLQKKGREERIIVTGNILAGFSFVNNQGRIINYTDDKGEVHQGILMPKSFDPQKFINEKPVTFPNARALRLFLSERTGKSVTAEDGNVEVFIGHDGDLTVEVPSSRIKGGKYFLSRPVLDAAGKDFVKSGSVMRMKVSPERAERVLAALMAADAKFIENVERDRATKAIERSGKSKFSAKLPEEPGAVDAQGNPLPQTVIPGAERMSEREINRRKMLAENEKKLQGKPGQKAVTGLGMFGGEPEATPAAKKKDQGSLFEAKAEPGTRPRGRVVRLAEDAIAELATNPTPEEQAVIDKVTALARKILPGANVIAARHIARTESPARKVTGLVGENAGDRPRAGCARRDE